MKSKTHIQYGFVLVAAALIAATSAKAQSRLDEYIREGLNSNQSIKQQDFVLEKNVYALKEAKSMFGPEVTFSTTYTKADGGRTIEFPTGDLFNGVYSTLNKLTGSNAFPQLQNQHILLNPDNFYDAKFRTTLPILNAELIYNKRIKAQQVDLQKTEVQLHKRELVKEIKTAYYNYSKAIYATGIYESSLRLVEESQRINTKLYDNSKVNRTVVLRSQNEVSRINASLTGAKKIAESARYYFNFLINRSLTDSILLDDITTLPAREQLLGNSVSGREELSKLRIAKDINGNLNGLAKSYIIPKLGTFIDLGSQAFDWKFNSQSRYYLLGVSLEWNLFSSGKNSYRVKQTIADREALASQTDYVQQQLLTELKVRQAAMQSAIAQYEAAQSQLKTSQTYYNDMVKLYKQGMAIYIELLDAQNQWIDAQLNANIAIYDTWIAYTAIERANASFTIQQ
ncbi:TolC family protein [Mucilaginibacter rubeus]|uniref:TolC family protein n=1 Tax=Mucilaginibacter rubeus TaxID=2027860 RepID=A0AAE6MHQ1_9SPHI|nr:MULTISPECIES: TolC family protein [Mucilaginibacter]QEM03768.1 TolC family protein [Mucilaginibacter rubeus]QEM16380.1 TolC family protein [Mucilaginibacter gossypii]QTE40853.1 TolC family protein [Mucilaginibacter rubeus]QTE47456.1 TolC family protein [Mucilaginibacter rubeus]QTE58849.1 TolC family protein [Mucilaginibacter rubeus]